MWDRIDALVGYTALAVLLTAGVLGEWW